MSHWQVEIEALAGTPVSFLEGQDLEVTRRLNGGTTGKFALEARDSKVADVALASRAALFRRNGVARVHGKIWEPLEWNQDRVICEVHDPWSTLAHRRVRSTTAYAQIDAGTIAWNLIDDQNTIHTTRIRQGALALSKLRDRTYEARKPVAEAITQLSEVINGFWFRFDPISGVAGTHAEFVVLYPQSGATKPEVNFEFGDGTRATLEGYRVLAFLPRNRMVAVGATLEGDATLATVSTDASSISTYDLFDEEVAFSSVELSNTLQEHADEELRPSPIETYEVVPSIDSPMLWDDFDVGDIVSVYIKNGEFTRRGTARVIEATVRVTNDGDTEILSQVVLQAVSIS